MGDEKSRKRKRNESSDKLPIDNVVSDGAESSVPPLVPHPSQSLLASLSTIPVLSPPPLPLNQAQLLAPAEAQAQILALIGAQLVNIQAQILAAVAAQDPAAAVVSEFLSQVSVQLQPQLALSTSVQQASKTKLDDNRKRLIKILQQYLTHRHTSQFFKAKRLEIASIFADSSDLITESHDFDSDSGSYLPNSLCSIYHDIGLKLGQFGPTPTYGFVLIYIACRFSNHTFNDDEESDLAFFLRICKDYVQKLYIQQPEAISLLLRETFRAWRYTIQITNESEFRNDLRIVKKIYSLLGVCLQAEVVLNEEKLRQIILDGIDPNKIFNKYTYERKWMSVLVWLDRLNLEKSPNSVATQMLMECRVEVFNMWQVFHQTKHPLVANKIQEMSKKIRPQPSEHKSAIELSGRLSVELSSQVPPASQGNESQNQRGKFGAQLIEGYPKTLESQLANLSPLHTISPCHRQVSVTPAAVVASSESSSSSLISGQSSPIQLPVALTFGAGFFSPAPQVSQQQDAKSKQQFASPASTQQPAPLPAAPPVPSRDLPPQPIAEPPMDSEEAVAALLGLRVVRAATAPLPRATPRNSRSYMAATLGEEGDEIATVADAVVPK